MRNTIRDFFKSVQHSICSEITRINGVEYHEDIWTRQDETLGSSTSSSSTTGTGANGGGGVTRVYDDLGSVLEKGGINFSEVYGEFTPEFAKTLPRGEGVQFYATGISLVLHPKNPFAPTVHANYRYLERGSAGWFGGGADLTPCYVYEEDAIHFHRAHAEALKPFGSALYPKFKKQCDEYFYLPHRKETRGIGGIFFDYESGDGTDEGRAKTFEMVQSCANAFVQAYTPILKQRADVPYGLQEKNFQEMRRGRYVEFNLIYDRGTTFGLKTNGRVESILMSLPRHAQWIYDFQALPGSREAELANYLKPRDWLGLAAGVKSEQRDGDVKS